MLDETRYADPTEEARRQATICNACRYCEGYCAVFPALHRARAFSGGDISHLANLCHNCRGCYYACQYTAPHAFDLNLPRALAEARRESWRRHAWPAPLAALFDRSGTVMAALLTLAFAALFALAQALEPTGGEGFYAHLSHAIMVAVFAPAFLLPLAALAVSVRRYWAASGGGRVRLADLRAATRSSARMTNLAGGHGDGCNFEDEDRFGHARRAAHQLTLYGFLLCFASTTSGTVLHYGFGIEAPYGPLALPKLLGVPGGILLCAGTAWLAALKLRADPALGAPSAWGGEMAFVLLLCATGATGLALYWAGGTAAVPVLLPLHLGAVLTLFVLTPYSKMVHGAYRMAALAREAMLRREAGMARPV